MKKKQLSTKEASVSTLLKSSIWYTAATFATKALAFITTPIFARVLSVEEFGYFHVYANWQNTLIIIAGLEICATVNRARFDYQSEEELDSYISSCLFINTVVTTVMLGIYLAFYQQIDRIMQMDHSYVAIMFAFFYTRPAFDMFQVEQRIQYRYKLSAAITFTSLLGSSLLALFLALEMTDARLLGRIAGQYVPFVIVGLGFYIHYFRRNHHIDPGKCRYAIRLAIPLVFSYMSGQILLASDKIIVQIISDSTSVAYVGIATTCSHVMLIFVSCLGGAWSPWFYDKLALGKRDEIKKMFRLFFWFIVLCTFGAVIVGPELIMILGGKNYMPALVLIPPTMLSGALSFLTFQFGAYETFYNKPHYASIVTLITALVNIALDIAGIRMFGYIAACYVTLICYLLLILLHLIAARKLEMLELFPPGELLISTAVLLAMIPITLFLYQNNVLRFSFFGLFMIGFGATLYRNKGILRSTISMAGEK